MNGINESEFIEAAEQATSWRRPLLITHSKPDGDALGSLISMRSLLRLRGIEAQAVVFDPVPERYAFMDSKEPLMQLGRDLSLADKVPFDGVIILDTCAYSQLQPVAEWLQATTIPRMAIDHHVTRDGAADRYLVDESAAATSLIVFELARAAHWTIDRIAAEALFVGIATDTGWFRHSNTDQRVFDAAGQLASFAIFPNELFGRLYQRESASRFKLRGAAMQSLELLAQSRLAVMKLTQRDFAVSGAEPADTEDLVNEPLRISSVLVSAIMVEQADGVVRLGLRSRAPGNDQSPDIDVAAAAEHFRGGGHRRAAGARLEGTPDEAYERVVTHLSRCIRAAIESPSVSPRLK